MDRLAKAGAVTAKVHYGARGWVVHHLSDLFDFTAPADGVWGVWPTGGAWLARHPWEHYLYSGDKKFLKDRAYPLMKGSAQFILDFLVPAPAGTPFPGKLVPCPSHSPENSFRKPDGTTSQFTYGATMDLEICWDLLTNTAQAADLCGDPEFAAQCRKAIDNLAPLQISPRDGRLQEWIEDYDDVEVHHRHTSHLYGLDPGNEISIAKTPALAEAAKKSLLVRGDEGTGWSMAWKINHWARFQDGDHAFKLLSILLRNNTLTDLFDTHPPFQIDGNFGATAGIAEMLLQSHADEIHFLPALPSAWPTGSFKGLRARGGCEVGVSWKAGRATTATVKATIGSTIRLRAPKGQKIVAITEHGNPVATSDGGNGTVAVKVQGGRTYTVKFD